MSSDVVDIEEVVRSWAWKMFDATKSRDQAKLPKECLQMQINWKRAKFQHGEPEYIEKEKPPEPKSQVLFKTFFTNSTDQQQEYSFKTERATRSCCNIEFERAYTIGEEMSLTLKTPCEVFEANAGFHRELSLTNIRGESIEEELIWSVDSIIKVPPRHRTTAKLVISEDKFSGKFTVKTTIAGKVHVTFTNMKDNNSFVKSLDGSIVDILRAETENGLQNFHVKSNKVTFTTKGMCNFMYAIEQHVKLKQDELTEEELQVERT